MFKSIFIAAAMLLSIGQAPPQMTGKPILFVLAGESNPGGLAHNSDALPREKKARPQLPILNNESLEFEPLKIGKNNLIGHSGLEYAMYTSHGMELELANKVNYLEFGNRPCYLVKGGQGGSTTAMWSPGVSPYYFDTLSKRLDAALAEILAQKFQYPQVVVMLSIGINERSDTPPETYKARIETLIANIRSSYGFDAIIGLMQFQFVGTMDNYNAKLQEIAVADSNVFVFSTAGCGNIGDGIHLNYSGFKICTNRFVDSVKTKL